MVVSLNNGANIHWHLLQLQLALGSAHSPISVPVTVFRNRFQTAKKFQKKFFVKY